METYVSILRGINVGGKNPVNMDDLKKRFKKLGFVDVKTYIQSGNIIFKSDSCETKSLEHQITQMLFEGFGFKIATIVMKIDFLKQIIERNPLKNDPVREYSFLHVTFLNSPPDFSNKQVIIEKKQAEEEIWFSERAIYIYCPGGYGKTKLTNNFLESKLKVVATTRNWKTTTKLFSIAKEYNEKI